MNQMGQRYPNSAAGNLGGSGGSLKPTNPNNRPPNGDYQAYGNPGGYPPQNGYPQQPTDLMGALRNSLTQRGNGTNSFDWSKVGQQSRLTEEQRNSLQGALYGEESEDTALRYEVSQHVAQIMSTFIRDCNMLNTRRYYALYSYGVESFLCHGDPQLPKDPTRIKFMEFVKQIQALKTEIYVRASILAGYQLTNAYMNGQAPNQRDIESIFTTCVHNVLVLEMMNWFSQVPEGQQAYYHLNPYEQKVVAKLEDMKAAAGECFVYMGFPNPYAELNPTPKERIAVESLPSNYQTSVYATQQHLNHNNFIPTDHGDQDPWADLRNDIMKKSTRRAVNQNSELFVAPEYAAHERNHQDFTVSNFLRTDYENLTITNSEQFNLDVLVKVPNTEYYLVDPKVWYYTKIMFRRSRKRKHRPARSNETITLITFDDEANKTGWVENVFNFKGGDLRLALDNPEVLLPYIVENDQNQLEIVTKELADYVNTEKREDFVPLSVKELGEKPTVMTNDLAVVSSESAEIENTVNAAFDSFSPKGDNMFALASAVCNYQKFRLNNEEEVKSVHRHLPFLVKGEGSTTKDFFTLIDVIENLFINRFNNDELEETIKNHITEALNRWLVECRGFGATSEDMYHYSVGGDLYQGVRDMREFLAEHDTDTLQALCEARRCARLLDRCRLFASKERTEEVLGKDTDALTGYSNKSIIVIDRELVIARVKNSPAPIPVDGVTTFAVKRSVNPELFFLAEQAYGRAGAELCSGADLIISFDSDNSLWLFITGDFDKNVATLRKMTRKSQLVNYRF